MAKAKLNLSNDTADLDEELKQLRASKEPVAPVSEEPAEEDVAEFTEEDQLLELLASFGIYKEDIDQAKHVHGKVYTFVYNDAPYIFRGLKKREYSGIMAYYNELPESNKTEDKIKWHVLKRAVIFPKWETEDQFDDELAGVQNSLMNLVMLASGFIEVNAALQSTREL